MAGVLNVAHGHGLAGLAGSASAVGVVGYALGGGNGWLARRYGLCSDMIDAAEVVMVDGNRRWVSADAEPDLLWALRGGGGNFGVVTSLRVRLHPARDMLAGSVVYNWNEASAVLRRYASFAATAPDELGISVGAMPGPNGEPLIMVFPLWNGDR